jgi:hypothetical protein
MCPRTNLQVTFPTLYQGQFSHLLGSKEQSFATSLDESDCERIGAVGCCTRTVLFLQAMSKALGISNGLTSYLSFLLFLSLSSFCLPLFLLMVCLLVF